MPDGGEVSNVGYLYWFVGKHSAAEKKQEEKEREVASLLLGLEKGKRGIQLRTAGSSAPAEGGPARSETGAQDEGAMRLDSEGVACQGSTR
ncbi:hypothetical protein EYF80_024407 [Liparis tanakae]|uniref:Uncharacterized protein n=1 Tax=Liparis tanakae TaxID=230148 RepID=A0A4Z2HIG6_9TELE|nr:hypothetical protein EYF80_024407 [Liparis tanakae]